ncbi:hypothetical protein EDB80DRAFT_872466 [Ilyonectria destructans]|nr:hypothetical protein EDB80DRAFT_872466 [Ilyonectria destructans]
MSFGFGVGDVIAVMGLFERLATEMSNYRDAPQHFQQLQAELGLLRSTIQNVLQIEPSSDEEAKNLGLIRAIAIHCNQPLQAFIQKMRVKEKGLGHFRTSGLLASVGTRLHWSMISRKDVEDLRKVLLSEMLAINILLGTHQLISLRRLHPEIEKGFKTQSDRLTGFAQEISMLRETSIVAPAAILGLRSFVGQQSSESTKRLVKIDKGINNIDYNVQALGRSLDRMTEVGQIFGQQVTTAFMQLFSFLSQLSSLLRMLLKCSREVLEAVAKNAAMLLELRNQMQRAAKEIEAIPLHLSLDLIRFDDALGESWALPFQACQQWDAFKEMLQVVVFSNDRPGAQQIATEDFVLTIPKLDQNIQPWEWSRLIKPGMHIEHSMIIDGLQSFMTNCSFPGCVGELIRDPDRSTHKLW